MLGVVENVKVPVTVRHHAKWMTGLPIGWCAQASRIIRPTDEHFRVLLFPVDGKPEVIWHPSRWFNDDQEDERYQSFDQKSILGPDALPRGSSIQYNAALKWKLLNTIYICHRDSFLIDGSKPNHSIA